MWVLLSLVAAVSTALRDVASKRAVRGVDPVVVGLVIAAVPAVVLGAVVVVGGGLHAPGPGFWLALAICGGINTVTTPLIVWALQRSELSLITPLTSLTPLFMLVTGVVVLAEVPGPRGVVGVATIVAGAWLLALPARRDRPPGADAALAPLRALARDPGARAMLVVAFLYSISATYDKVGVQASTPLAWAASVNGVVALALGGVLLGGRATRWRAEPAMVLAAGLLSALIAAAQMTALTLTLAAYVIAVKRTSTLFGVVLGHVVFREANLRARLGGAAVMLVGFLVLTLGR